MKRLILAGVFLISTYFTSFAQSPNYIGSTWSFGRSIIHENLPEEYAYRPVSILGFFPIERFGNFSIYGEYQFTQALNRFNQSDYEFGLNMGIQYHIPLSIFTTLTAGIGSGPHYITVETDRQANGFIFSDNFELNLRHYFRNLRSTVQLTGRFRHVSNAGLQSPNGGIDNFFLMVGVERQL